MNDFHATHRDSIPECQHRLVGAPRTAKRPAESGSQYAEDVEGAGRWNASPQATAAATEMTGEMYETGQDIGMPARKSKDDGCEGEGEVSWSVSRAGRCTRALL